MWWFRVRVCLGSGWRHVLVFLIGDWAGFLIFGFTFYPSSRLDFYNIITIIIHFFFFTVKFFEMSI